MRDIKPVVKRLIHKYDTNDPYRLCWELGIKVFHKDLGSIMGIFQQSRRIQYIYINSALDDVRARQTCAHELGHSRLHADANACFLCTKTFMGTAKHEIQANIFAAELLIPDDIKTRLDVSIQDVAAEFGVIQDLARLKFR